MLDERGVPDVRHLYRIMHDDFFGLLGAPADFVPQFVASETAHEHEAEGEPWPAKVARLGYDAETYGPVYDVLFDALFLKSDEEVIDKFVSTVIAEAALDRKIDIEYEINALADSELYEELACIPLDLTPDCEPCPAQRVYDRAWERECWRERMLDLLGAEPQEAGNGVPDWEEGAECAA